MLQWVPLVHDVWLLKMMSLAGRKLEGVTYYDVDESIFSDYSLTPLLLLEHTHHCSNVNTIY